MWCRYYPTRFSFLQIVSMEGNRLHVTGESINGCHVSENIWAGQRTQIHTPPGHGVAGVSETTTQAWTHYKLCCLSFSIE